MSIIEARLRIEKRVKVAVALTIAVTFLSAAATAANEAWWLSWQPAASATSIGPLAVNAIDPRWRRVSLIDADHLPPAASQDRAWMKREGFVFALHGDLNRNGRPDDAVTGVYEDVDGKIGRFMLVVEAGRGGRRRPVFLAQEPGEPRFGVFVRKRDKVYWARCMQCGDVEEIRWTGKGLVLVPLG